jgi:hypothetical protein
VRAVSLCQLPTAISYLPSRCSRNSETQEFHEAKPPASGFKPPIIPSRGQKHLLVTDAFGVGARGDPATDYGRRATVAPACNSPAGRGTMRAFPAPTHPPANASCWSVIPPGRSPADTAVARRDSPQRPVPRVGPVAPRNAPRTPCGNNPALHPTPATRCKADTTWYDVQNCRWERSVSCAESTTNDKTKTVRPEGPFGPTYL